ncbi:MAG: hypothetical protein NC225_08750 [Clostridium sp.]|nr:hypothetical protein [Clostridium sp.]MCM1460106.1 hypothetical protein [Bacteroides sp.]
MKRKVIAILLSLMLFGGAALQTYDSKAATLTVQLANGHSGEMTSSSNSSAVLQVTWSNKQGESKLTALKTINAITVNVSFGGFTASKNHPSDLTKGLSVRATKDVGYVHTYLNGSAVYQIK